MAGQIKECSKAECPMACGSDPVARVLDKVGITRSCLITLALMPFAWNGVVWVAASLKSLWDAATTAVGS